MNPSDLKQGVVLSGPMFPEPVIVQMVRTLSPTVLHLVVTTQRGGQTINRVLTVSDLAKVETVTIGAAFNGDAHRFRLGVEALRLGLAYEYDPFFSLSTSRVDPLPHQLEAVYDYFLKLPRIRFLLADDPGAGKTVMAGLLLKELKIRGLVKRVLIVTPANLTFQWAREMNDKFRERFDVLKGDVLRATYGANPFVDRDQVITSISWISRVEDARDSLLRARWDLVIVDEAHKMAAYEDKKTLAYKIGEQLRDRTDHYLLMTATPHKGDPENFKLFLQLLDEDVYGSITSLDEAMRRNQAPFYLRRVKEALVKFPDPVTGLCEKLYRARTVTTTSFELSDDEANFYEDLTRYVEEQSIRAADDDSPRGRAVGFTMAMLQRRQASSVYAVRRTLERMRDRRNEILEDPEGWRKAQIARKIPDDFEELDEEEQDRIVGELEAITALASSPGILREEVRALEGLIARARTLETAGVEIKLQKLREALKAHGLFDHPERKLLIFTEHKDTLDFLCGDGKDGRPLGRLQQWGISVTTIHGGMKIGDPATAGTRLHAEHDFKSRAQVMVATEAAGEGINLQFCSLMINYDIPWNPVRLEQRMGRIHRYGQEHDCFIFNFVATNTREGRVLRTLLQRLEIIREQLQSDQVFDVVGEVVPGNMLESLFRKMYARQLDEQGVIDRIVKDVDPTRFEKITRSTLEGLARRSLNLGMILQRDVDARARRLVPEVVRDFFLQASAALGMDVRPAARRPDLFLLGRVPRDVAAEGASLTERFGPLAPSYESLTFRKDLLKDNPATEWLTPGHPLFESVRHLIVRRCETELQRGASFYDLAADAPYTLDVYALDIVDGRNQTLHRRLTLIRTDAEGHHSAHDPALLLDLVPAPSSLNPSPAPVEPDPASREVFVLEQVALPLRDETEQWRARELELVARHIRVSMTDLINRANLRLSDFTERQIQGQAGMEPHIKLEEERVDDLSRRYQQRMDEIDRERQVQIGPYHHLGGARVLPHPERHVARNAAMVQSAAIERIAVDAVIAYERARGCVVESVEADNLGFDLISRRPAEGRPGFFVETRFIEVKGRAGDGDVALTANEYRTAERLRGDFWLYVVHHCATTPTLRAVQDPVRLAWEPVSQVARYHLDATQLPDTP